MEKGKGISKLSADLKSKLSLAYLDAVLQGSPAPLVDFYTRHEATLKNNYGVSLNQILNLDKEGLERVRNIRLKQPANNTEQGTEQGAEQGGVQKISEPKSKESNQESISSFDWIYPTGGLIAAGVGVYLIYKSLKK
jgi:hypothetical protein